MWIHRIPIQSKGYKCFDDLIPFLKLNFSPWWPTSGSMYSNSTQVYNFRGVKYSRLKKEIYGLKESPPAWFRRFSEAIQQILQWILIIDDMFQWGISKGLQQVPKVSQQTCTSSHYKTKYSLRSRDFSQFVHSQIPDIPWTKNIPWTPNIEPQFTIFSDTWGPLQEKSFVLSIYVLILKCFNHKVFGTHTSPVLPQSLLIEYWCTILSVFRLFFDNSQGSRIT